jgi:hypothetical protein
LKPLLVPTTWAFVTMLPSPSNTTPDPSPSSVEISTTDGRTSLMTCTKADCSAVASVDAVTAAAADTAAEVALELAADVASEVTAEVALEVDVDMPLLLEQPAATDAAMTANTPRRDICRTSLGATDAMVGHVAHR